MSSKKKNSGNTLNNWLGVGEEEKLAGDIRVENETNVGKEKGNKNIRLVLGVLGGHKAKSFQEFNQTILADLLVKLDGKLPELVILNDDGKDSSALLYMWCEKNDIPCRYMRADWTAGKRAGIIRDNQIIQEASALLLFQGPRSLYLKNIANKLEKKGIKFLSVTV
jgi:hypothetical protein